MVTGGIRRIAAGSTALLIAVSMAGTGTALAADPSDTVDVNRVPSLQPRITVLGVSEYGVLYTYAPRDGSPVTTMLKPRGRPAYQVNDDLRILRGDRIYASYAGRAVRYQLIGETTERTCGPEYRPLYAYDGAAAFTTFGWLSTEGRRITADSDGCQVSGTGPDIGDHQLTAAGDDGYLTSQPAADGGTTLVHHPYADPGRAVPIPDGGHNRNPHDLVFVGTTVAWLSTEGEVTHIVRSSTIGASVQATRAQRNVAMLTVSDTATGWAGCSGFDDPAQCWAGSISAAGVMTERQGSQSIGSDGQRFVVDTYGESPGIDALDVVADDSPRTRIATVGLLPPESFSVRLRDGLVSYTDNEGQELDQNTTILHRRRVVATSTGPNLGPVRDLGRVGSDRLGQGAAGTAYLDTSGDLWLWTAGGGRTRIFDARPQVSAVGSGPIEVDGQRLIWTKGLYTGTECFPWGCEDSYGDRRLMIRDLRTGADTEVLRFSSAGQRAVVDAHHLVYTDGSERILHRDLRTGATRVLRGASGQVRGLDVAGEVVGWSACTPAPDASCPTATVGYRDLSSSDGSVERTVSEPMAVQVGAGFVSFTTAPTMDHPRELSVWRLGTDQVTRIGRLGAYDRFDADGRLLAWIGPDRVVRVTQLAGG